MQHVLVLTPKSANPSTDKRRITRGLNAADYGFINLLYKYTSES